MESSPQNWEKIFEERQPFYERLKDEVLFALRDGIQKAGIKTHLVHGRVKGLSSLSAKVVNKEYNDPIEEVGDIVGVRVVVLFLSDLPRLDALIKDSFEVLGAEDMVEDGDPASFGYMSVHYRARLSSAHQGPRYNELKGIQFEVQTRTIVMDAWANVSHYLDYKGRSSIPDELRRDFFALSGLFYVADQHFEIFAQRALESQHRAEERLQGKSFEGVNIDLDTVSAYLSERFPEREHADRSVVSEFVEEITRTGYEDLESLSKALEAGWDLFLAFEKEHPPSEGGTSWAPHLYRDIGAARLSLAFADQEYLEMMYARDGSVREFWARSTSE
jgi:GTP pyrophosphokinase